MLALAERLATIELPAWRSASTIADADGYAMVRAVETSDPDSEVFIAEQEGKAAGCLHILAATDFFGLRHAHVSVIATSASAEGTGIGRALMMHAEEWARRRNLRLLTLNVFAANTRARRFYENAGFAPEFLKYAKPIEPDREK